jgi:ribonuclease G
LPLAEWLYEAGIGEVRAALVEHNRIIEAAIECEGSGPRAGTIAEGRLVEIIVSRLQGRVTLGDGSDVLLDGIPPGLTEGRTLVVRIVREAIPEPGRKKLPKAIAALDEMAPCPGPDLLARIKASGQLVRQCHAHEPDRLEAAGWSELLEEAETGEIAFTGGVLRLSVTPAMTLFDVDGSLPTAALSVAAASAVGAAIVRHGIGGSIGIDFPTMPDKSARKAAGAALDAALPLPFERTAINGFGFMQIVRRRTRASLPEILREDPVGAALRATLRRIEREALPGGQSLSLPPTVRDRLSARPDWMAELERRTGRSIDREAPPS